MHTLEKVKTWQKTRLQNLIRHKSGVYYARAFANGKEIWKSLRTSHFSVAKVKLADFLREQRERRSAAESARDGKMTFADALAVHTQKIRDNVSARRTKETTRHYWAQIFAALRKSWPDLWDRQVKRISAPECQAWASKFARVASANRFNNTVAGLRHVFEIALDSAVIYSNPAAKIERMPIRQRRLTLPSASQFLALVESIRSAGGWCSRDCGDFVEGLAVTGIRKRDASELEWRDLDFAAGEIVVRGDPETATKNWTVYRVPMIDLARRLFERMRSERLEESPTEKVFRVQEAQKAIDSACRKLGIERITHHDMRHLFATVCIESGVDIPTVSRWLNHKDGGVLAMKTYGHLRNEHSIAQAKRVTFDSTG
ncbi:MAG: tyrosine-type recombinase/integrase [Verrucomicrobiota bacterium]|nr:tyrosine-type recombinase/integrase [Verrucomicrobiota bacterium]